MSTQLTAPDHLQNQNLASAVAANRVRSEGFRLRLLTDPPGLVEVPALRNTIVSIHVGSSVKMTCRRGAYRHSGTAVHGDIDIIPAGTPSSWELRERDTALVLSVSPELLALAAEESGFNPARVEIRNRFQERDAQLENIGWALKAEMESGYPSGRLYLDSLAISVATRLIRVHSSVSVEPATHRGRLSGRRLKDVLSYIEDNLTREISLREIAGVAGLSVSHFKVLFREAIGLPAHQYVIRRRVERAKALLGDDNLPISQIALETGFAHQSHLAYHMRRLTGHSPRAVRKMLR
jgi:AraC family transcriptional regulator